MGAGVLDRLAMILLLIALLQPAHAAGWYDSDWTARQEVTISPALADGDLSGFPILVRIADPANDIFANAQASGNDILFTAADGTTKVSHEIEYYDAGSALLYAWVRVPLLSSSADTTLFMYYGNAAAPDQQDVGGTWDSDFVMVQHLQETTGTHFDSTTYDNDGTPQNGVAQNATGQVDGADQFDGSNDFVLVADDPNLQVVEMTVEAWVYVPGSIPGGFHGIAVHAPSTSNWYGLHNNGNRFHYRWSSGAVRRTDFSATFAPDQWYYVAGVLDVPNDRVLTYQNETTDTTINGPSPPTPTAGSTRIGSAFASSERFQGFIDEVRISRIARSPAWIRASYRVQNAPETYITLGPEVANIGVSGLVFEDANFTGTASAYDGGANDQALVNVDVELYDNADSYITSVTTDAGGNYAFSGLADGTYKVRVRSATVGDSNTPPVGTFNAACGITDPASGPGCVVAEQTWGNGAAMYGGQSATVDDTATDAAAGPGDTWIAVTVAGADKTNLDFGFAYNLITNTNDAGQGSLRRFIANANAISAAAGTTANASEFRIPLIDPNYNAGTGVFTISLASALPAVADANTDIDGRTQTANVGDTNAGNFIHPFYGASTDVGTGADGVEGSGDELTLPVYDQPEIEIDGNDQGIILELAANGSVLKHLALYNAPSFATGVLLSAGTSNVVEDSFIGLRADGSDPGAGLRVQHGVEVFGGTATVQNNVVGYTENTAIIVERATLILGNDVYSASLGNPNGDGISTEGSSGQAITVRQNRIDFAAGYGVETWQAPGPFTIEDNTVSRAGQGGGVENGGIRVFGTGSSVEHNVINGNSGAGIPLVQRGTPGSNQQNRISENAIYANGGIGIDLDVTNTGGAGNPNGDGVTANNGTLNATLPNSDMDYPVFTSATLIGSTLSISGYIGTVGVQIPGTHTIEAFKVDDDANNNGEIEIGDTLNVPHGEGRWYIDTCTTAVTGFFNCDLIVPASVTLSVGDNITATARGASDNTSEFAANVAVESGLTIHKRAYWPDGMPIPNGATIPQDVEFKFMLYINNMGPAVTDVSIQDVLDPLFAYQPGTIQVDISVAACALEICTPAEESAIFSAVSSAPLLSDAVDADVTSYSPTTVDVGDEYVANARLDIAATRVLAILFSAKVQ